MPLALFFSLGTFVIKSKSGSESKVVSISKKHDWAKDMGAYNNRNNSLASQHDLWHEPPTVY